MSTKLPPSLALREEDVRMMLACGVHLGARNLDPSMRRYVFKRRAEDGVHIIDLRKTWEKLLLAARIIVAVENPKDVCVIAIQASKALPVAQRAILKFSHHVGCTAQAGRFTPGTFTNQIQAKYLEPRVLIATDPLKDHQPITESSYVNVPVIAFADTDNNLRYVDVAIPCNNKGKNSIALMYWLLAREVLRLRETISRESPWDVMVDMFVYRDTEDSEKHSAESGVEGGFGGQTNYESSVPTLDTVPQSSEWGGEDGVPEDKEDSQDWKGTGQWSGEQDNKDNLGNWDNSVVEEE
eukprot:TRINITY_DN19_c0_g1_i3.p1 TRINITY_DN19_c0_g1~~TRINITY_DN19_c0_g1_i3.p1  ORF type:complete len:296 (-),score=78.26 TRINITY_DN19_c0_g1_i3:75-962(-)